MKRVPVLKLGGELIENEQRLKALGKAIKSAAKNGRLVIVLTERGVYAPWLFRGSCGWAGIRSCA